VLYTRAREEQADTLADQILTIADETPETVPIYDKDGNVIDIKIDSGYVAYQKQRIEARKWTAMKLKPKKYGDKVAIGGDADNPIKVDSNVELFAELVEALKLKRQSE
jgi:deferrochelatase/peroxidase EfeB